MMFPPFQHAHTPPDSKLTTPPKKGALYINYLYNMYETTIVMLSYRFPVSAVGYRLPLLSVPEVGCISRLQAAGHELWWRFFLPL